jgi:kynurenine aminotransferase
MRNGYLQAQRDLYRKQRDRLIGIFGRLGLPVAVTQGSYFLMVNTEKLRVEAEPVQWEESSDPAVLEPHDYTVCRWLTSVIGVTAIPTSSFYGPQNRHLAKNLARFCFCKTDETLDEAERRLMKLKEFLD